ncbi:MAG: DUF5668 domain-containing protein [Anaerolineae bacterium]
MNQDKSTFRRPPSLFWPIVLIGVGVVWLLSNMGMLTVNPWFVLSRFWPVLLIVAGLDILLGRTLWGAIASGIMGLLVIAGMVALLFYAQANPAWINSLGIPGIVINQGALHSQHIADPLGGAKQAEVNLSFGDGKYQLGALGASGNLVEGDVRYYGDLKHDVSMNNAQARVTLSSNGSAGMFLFNNEGEQWDLKLNPIVEYTLNLNTGSGAHNLDLSGLNVSSLNLNSGSGAVDVQLPAQGSSHVVVNSGSGAMNIRLPEGIAARVEYRRGSGSVDISNLHRVSADDHSGVYETTGFSQTGAYVLISVNSGSGSISVR